MFENQFVNTLVGGVGALLLTYLGKHLITTRERNKLEADQLKTQSEILQNHSSTISNLQSIVSKMTVENETMRERLIAIHTENQIMEDKLESTMKRVLDLENENKIIKEENDKLKAELLKHTNEDK